MLNKFLFWYVFYSFSTFLCTRVNHSCHSFPHFLKSNFSNSLPSLITKKWHERFTQFAHKKINKSDSHMSLFNPNHPSLCVCIQYMIQTLVHTCRGLGCYIFIEINVKRKSNPLPLKVFNIQHCSAHTVFSQAQLFQNIISKSVYLSGKTARLIRV